MNVNSLPKTVTRQRRDCDLNPGPSATESSTLTTRLPSHPVPYNQGQMSRRGWGQMSAVTVSISWDGASSVFAADVRCLTEGDDRSAERLESGRRLASSFRINTPTPRAVIRRRQILIARQRVCTHDAGIHARSCRSRHRFLGRIARTQCRCELCLLVHGLRISVHARYKSKGKRSI